MERIAYYVDCSCETHDNWKSSYNRVQMEEYYKNLPCKEKILYVETTNPDHPFFKLEESK